MHAVKRGRSREPPVASNEARVISECKQDTTMCRSTGSFDLLLPCTHRLVRGIVSEPILAP